MVDETDPLAAADFLVVADMTGSGSNARIVSAAILDEDMLRAQLASRIIETVDARFDAASGTLRARAVERLGAITLSERTLPAPKGADAEAAMLKSITDPKGDHPEMKASPEDAKTMVKWILTL